MLPAVVAPSNVPADLADLFAPPSAGLPDLLRAYEADRAVMEAMAPGLARADLVELFHAANVGDPRYGLAKLGDLEPALRALDARYWAKALALTDVLETMPQARREQWHAQLADYTAPPFTPEAVGATLRALLDQRYSFFAERVDGIFRGLSPDHVTNRPQGFGTRFILAGLGGFYSSASRACGLVHDLRGVLARLLGRAECLQYQTTRDLEYCQRAKTSEWVSLDGGALRVRCYKKGTAHCEIHPDLAWKLNLVLAHLHPAAIPASARTRPPRSAIPRDFALYDQVIPQPVLTMLQNVRAHGRVGPWVVTLPYHSAGEAPPRPVVRAAKNVLIALGGVKVGGGFSFDYVPNDAIAQVLATGLLPDASAHQFYPTPPDLATEAADLLASTLGASTLSGLEVLEPSAGQGALVKIALAQGARVHAIEIAPLHCTVLRGRGSTDVLQVTQGDFLALAPTLPQQRAILLNPPFSDGRALSHTLAALHLLAPGGALVAILPPSAARRAADIAASVGASYTISAPRPFPGTSIEVVLLAVRARG